jgi:PKD repeat protein
MIIATLVVTIEQFYVLQSFYRLMKTHTHAIALVLLLLFSSLKITAQTWSSLNSGMDDTVYDLEVYNNELYACGEFVYAGGDTVNFIARWDGTSWKKAGLGMNDKVWGLEVYHDELYASGWFTEAGGNYASHIAKWDGTNWSPVGDGLGGWNGYTYVGLRAMAVYNDELYVGGENFIVFGSDTALCIAKWNGTVWSAVAKEQSVSVLKVYNNNLYAGGGFSTFEGIAANGIVKWNGISWSMLEEGVIGGVYTLSEYNGDLYVGGNFVTAGNSPCYRIAKWIVSTWGAPIPGVGNIVDKTEVYNNEIYIGGEFLTVGSISAKYIAKWNGSDWSAAGLGTNGIVRALKEYNGALYVGGYFTQAGGINASYIAKWDNNPPPTCSADFYLVADSTIQHHYWAINQSTGISPVNYIWNWGDGNTDSIPVPSHTYDSAGLYNICLFVDDSTGCTSSICHDYTIMKSQQANDIFIVDVVDSIPGIPTSFSPPAILQSYNVITDPAMEDIYVNYTLSGSARVIIEVSDILGRRLIKPMNDFQSEGIYRVTVSSKDLSDGIYFVQIHVGTSAIAKEIIIVN